MANYIITDNGQGEIAVYDDVVEKTAARTYHVYKDIDRRNYPYAEFFKRVFYEDKNNTISSISIDTNPKNNDQMCYIFEANHNSKTSTFNISDYNKVETTTLFFFNKKNGHNFLKKKEVSKVKKCLIDSTCLSSLIENLQSRKVLSRVYYDDDIYYKLDSKTTPEDAINCLE